MCGCSFKNPLAKFLRIDEKAYTSQVRRSAGPDPLNRLDLDSQRELISLSLLVRAVLYVLIDDLPPDLKRRASFVASSSLKSM